MTTTGRPGAERPVAAAAEAGGVQPPLTSRLLTVELLLVLGVSLGASAVRALIDFTGSVTQGPLSEQQATLNGTAAPGRPWLDLAWQLYSIGAALVPVALVAYLMRREGARGLADLGLDLRRKRFDLGWGTAVAAAVGGTGLALYLAAQAGGANLTVVPTTLPDVWWRIPVLVLSAIQNSLLEEVVVLGYLMRRLGQAGWGFPAVVLASSVLRGTYHLYQGLGGFFGNIAMGVLFCLLYRRWRRIGPLVAAHALIDIVAFVGFVLLKGRVDWLPD